MIARQRQVQNRKNKVKVDSNMIPSDNLSTEQPSKRQYWPKKRTVFLFFSIVLLTLIYIGLENDISSLHYGNKAIDHIAVSLNLHKPFYVVIIDAGSTASRVIAFTFHRSVINDQLVLDDELFFETKPGLSAFAKNPKDVGKSLNILLEKAKGRVPRSDWSTTPLSLRATAGLRLLPGEEAKFILQETKTILASSGFQVTKDSVNIMDGSDEGIFSWFTANFLLDKFSNAGRNKDLSSDTVAAFDLGGGSTQVTFAITTNISENQPTELAKHEKNIYHINAFGKNLSIFTQSFLGMGLMAARESILTHPDNNENGSSNPDSDLSSEFINIRSKCINTIISGVEWIYGGKKYSISGPINRTHNLPSAQGSAGSVEDKPVVQFSECLEIIKKVVNLTVPHNLPDLKKHELHAFSYYFERAAEVGLIDPFNGGVITVGSFYKEAQKSCQDPNADQPFMCLDLSFIYVLLHDGFGFDQSTKIFLRKKINGHELSWALGAAFSILQNDS